VPEVLSHLNIIHSEFSMITQTVTLYNVPYNGPVGIVKTYRNGRLLAQTVEWYRDKDFLTVHVSIVAPEKMSKVNLLSAIYWMGTSIKGRSYGRLMREAMRPNVGQMEYVRTDYFKYPYEFSWGR